MPKKSKSKSVTTKRVVVFGSNILDLFFEVGDFSLFQKTGAGAEDALHIQTHIQAPGGKGANQAVAVAKAGAKVRFYGALGKGAHSRFILDNFRSVKINVSGIAQVNRPTGCAAIFTLPNGKHKVVVSQGANTLAKQRQVPDAVLGRKTIVLLQAELNLNENMMLAKRAKQRGASVVVNVAPARALPADFLKNIDVLILNQPEAETVAQALGHDASDLVQFAQVMAKSFHMTCIITLGEHGALAVMPERPDQVVRVPCLKIKAVDTVGAGDAFVGGLVAAMARNEPMETALCYGALAGSLACTKLGAQTALPTAQDIKRNLKKLGKLVVQPIVG